MNLPAPQTSAHCSNQTEGKSGHLHQLHFKLLKGISPMAPWNFGNECFCSESVTQLVELPMIGAHFPSNCLEMRAAPLWIWLKFVLKTHHKQHYIIFKMHLSGVTYRHEQLSMLSFTHTVHFTNHTNVYAWTVGGSWRTQADMREPANSFNPSACGRCGKTGRICSCEEWGQRWMPNHVAVPAKQSPEFGWLTQRFYGDSKRPLPASWHFFPCWSVDEVNHRNPLLQWWNEGPGQLEGNMASADCMGNEKT